MLVLDDLLDSCTLGATVTVLIIVKYTQVSKYYTIDMLACFLLRRKIC